MNDSPSLESAFTEPILRDNPNRFVMFPIEHDDVWGLYKRTQSALWVAQEIFLEMRKMRTLTH